jgi:DMSO/TMAO reductase YedYZ molybdopterin-dependent catalytic subunit
MSDRHPEITVTNDQLKRELRRRTRRDFLIGGIAAAAAIGGYEWLRHANDDEGEPWPERRILDLNGRIAGAYVSDSHLMPTYSKDQIRHLKPNGDIGLNPAFDFTKWNLQVDTGVRGGNLKLTLADIQSLPRQEMITRFCCIEGWSVITAWAGARFSDFTRKYLPPGRTMPGYVYMETPDQNYYVGLDMKSALHPQTLLAYEQNGNPLAPEHGAPLRLVIPVKYGIKSIKRIGLIRYTDSRPGDYWYEDGYDWFAGL